MLIFVLVLSLLVLFIIVIVFKTTVVTKAIERHERKVIDLL